MMTSALMLLTIYLILLLPLAWIIGHWLAAIATGQFHSLLSPVVYLEKQLYRLIGTHSERLSINNEQIMID